MPTDLAETENERVPLETAEDVARFLELPKWRLTRWLYGIEDEQKYASFEIPKRSGGLRRIDAPQGVLRQAQDRLLPYLQRMHRAHPGSHGFLHGRSVVSNAEIHTGQRLVLNIDLADFFPSVNFGRVRGLFMAKPFEMGAAAATICAQICTFRNGLPQGAPTSPVLSNFIASALDRRLSRLARENGLKYSRYADDITFSTSRALFPASVARLLGDGPQNGVEVGEALEQAVTACGFAINPAKVRLQSRHVRQSVTGVTVNEKANVTRERVRRLRAMLHAWEKFGLEAAGAEYVKRYARGKGPGARNDPGPAFRNTVYGELAYLKMVRGEEDAIFRKFCGKLAALDPAPTKLLRRAVFGSDDFEVFISHASEDKDAVARPIFEACDSLGIKAFLDQDHIELGENYTQKINIALGAARTVLVIVSPVSAAKPWPLQEINTALSLEVTGEKTVIPLKVGDPDLSRLPLIRGKDWMEWDGDAMKVARRLKQVVAGEPAVKAAAAPSVPPTRAEGGARPATPAEQRAWFMRLFKR